MKYRRLSDNELKQLKSEFSEFLSSFDLDEKKWEQLNSSKPGEANVLLENFSDLIFDNVMENIRHLERKQSERWEVMQVHEDGIEQITVKVNEGALVDLTNPDCIEDLATYESEELGRLISIAKSERKYDGNRQHEIFQMMESGFYSVDKSVYEALNRLHEANMSLHHPSI